MTGESELTPVDRSFASASFFTDASSSRLMLLLLLFKLLLRLGLLQSLVNDDESDKAAADKECEEHVVDVEVGVFNEGLDESRQGGCCCCCFCCCLPGDNGTVVVVVVVVVVVIMKFGWVTSL